MSRPPIRFNAFSMNTPVHQSPGLWRHPRNQCRRFNQLDYWLELAQLLERGRFDALFLADTMGFSDVYQGRIDSALAHGVQAPIHDPLVLVAALAGHTRHLGFGLTFSLSYEHPYPFARRISTLDHLSGGRIAWNIVTGYLNSAAQNNGLPRQLPHDQRYDQADEYLEVLYKLWEYSWEDDALVNDAQRGVFIDPAKVHPIEHAGQYYQVPGVHICEPSPQRTPVLFQAGASARGQRFAAEHAECLFISAPTQAALAGYVRALRQAAREAGRSGQLIYAQALVIVDSSDEAAQARYADYRRYVDVPGALTLLSGWTGIDFSGYAPDAVIRYLENDAGRTALGSFTLADPQREWTVGEAAEFISLGGRGPVLVGSAATVADSLEEWLDNTGIDGFNLTYAVAHDDLRAVVEHLVPELQRRGRYPLEYPEGTLRHKLFGRGDRLPPEHRGRRR
ncbi:LLM class flavin-dependent oxidoreductase [Zestomonas thermotolerans]|uniref:LLM class flavin-dependent oxidoreductase n=1 Tax=Zestomonas thermotolerans TaxID=157784 RepID=UPI0023F2D70C|nr:LLM class flavin-dependent oxidoreductase [Pseudomonas thermotolerans]